MQTPPIANISNQNISINSSSIYSSSISYNRVSSAPFSKNSPKSIPTPNNALTAVTTTPISVKNISPVAGVLGVGGGGRENAIYQYKTPKITTGSNCNSNKGIIGVFIPKTGSSVAPRQFPKHLSSSSASSSANKASKKYESSYGDITLPHKNYLLDS